MLFVLAAAALAANLGPELLDRETVFTGDFYPPAAMRMHEEGVTRFSVDVDTTGRVSRCTIKRSSGFSDLDERTCALMLRRAHFRPATDGQGAPVEGSYAGQFAWQIHEIDARKTN